MKSTGISLDSDSLPCATHRCKPRGSIFSPHPDTMTLDEVFMSDNQVPPLASPHDVSHHDNETEGQLISILRDQLSGQRRLIMVLSCLIALLLSATVGGGIWFKFFGIEGGSDRILATSAVEGVPSSVEGAGVEAGAVMDSPESFVGPPLPSGSLPMDSLPPDLLLLDTGDAAGEFIQPLLGSPGLTGSLEPDGTGNSSE